MGTYYMKHQAPWQYPITMGLLMFCVGGIGYLLNHKLLIPNSDIVIPGVMIGLFWLGYYLLRRTAVADVSITVDDNGISQTFLSQTFLSNKPDVFIRWEDMTEYMYERGFRGPDIFRIRTINGRTWGLFRYKSFKKDDFERFRADFSARIEQFNEANKGGGLIILEGKSSLQGLGGIVFAALLMTVMIGLPIAMIIRPDITSLGALGIVYPVGLGFVILIYTERKKRREYEQRLSERLSAAVQENDVA